MFPLNQFNNKINKLGLDYKIIYKKKTGSTNDDALQKIKQKTFKENSLFISDIQTNSRGRQNKVWHNTPNLHLAFSLIMCPDIEPKKNGLVSLLSSVSIVDGLKEIFDKNFKIKWPNDIIYKNKKLAGILIETKKVNKKLVFVIGIGININEEIHDFPLELKNNVTSLKIITKKNQKKEQVLLKILKNIQHNYRHINSIHSKWISHCKHIDKHITFNFENKKINGKFLGITQNGHAVIKINNENHIFPNGELSL
tara:strand:+ start:1031 stop:1792 length:762 start_codon:yes stop_codon:yes gene_type:complete